MVYSEKESQILYVHVVDEPYKFWILSQVNGQELNYSGHRLLKKIHVLSGFILTECISDKIQAFKKVQNVKEYFTTFTYLSCNGWCVIGYRLANKDK